ncbi:MAG: transcription termination factor NusA [Gemmataceae bacterium]|nr:transcription termination factor NusA [Gemmataceae bacterium]MDW8265262.1 transcription termination factor NusA [Gemmataceae bacterium]
MNGADLLRIVELMHREKNIPKEVIFEGIEAAVQVATERHYGDEEDIVVTIDRNSGEIKAQKGGTVIDPALLGRIAAQSAKQAMIQKIREAECNAVFDEYAAMKGDLVTGTVQRLDGETAIVALGRSEAILPRSEQIPGEKPSVGERIKAVILEVRKTGHRVKIILSRTHPDFVRRLFEQEIPEIADRTIEIKALAREAGYRTKIAVSSIDLKVDCVGACVGVRGSRIKNIVDELGGERIDIVRWNDSLQVMIPNALQPATIEEVFLYPRLGRAIVLVREDQLSLAIGKRGQNVRLASKLVGWDIEIMTHEELTEGIERAQGWFLQIPGITDEQVETFIEEGFLSYDDLTFLHPAQMAELAGISEEQAEEWIAFCEQAAEQVEEESRHQTEEIQAGAKTEPPADQAATPARPSVAAAMAALRPSGSAESEPRPTVESVFGPDARVRPQEPTRLSAAQVFGEEPPPPKPDEPRD